MRTRVAPSRYCPRSSVFSSQSTLSMFRMMRYTELTGSPSRCERADAVSGPVSARMVSTRSALEMMLIPLASELSPAIGFTLSCHGHSLHSTGQIRSDCGRPSIFYHLANISSRKYGKPVSNRVLSEVCGAASGDAGPTVEELRERWNVRVRQRRAHPGLHRPADRS